MKSGRRASGVKYARTRPVTPVAAGTSIRIDAVAPRHVELPADPDEREALAHQEAVAESASVDRSADAAARLNPVSTVLRPRLTMSIERDAVALRRVLRLEDLEIGGELDQPGGVARRLVEIGDDPVARVRRIDDEVDLADDQLVGAGRPKARPASTSRRDAISTRATSAAASTGTIINTTTSDDQSFSP